MIKAACCQVILPRGTKFALFVIIFPLILFVKFVEQKRSSKNLAMRRRVPIKKKVFFVNV